MQTTEWPKVHGATTEWRTKGQHTIALRLDAGGSVDVQAVADRDRTRVFVSLSQPELNDPVADDPASIVILTPAEARAFAAYLLEATAAAEADAL